MRVRPVDAGALRDELVERVVVVGAGRLRVIVDGAPPTRPEALAAELAGELRLRGRSALPVAAGDFLRPASVRFERGREDPDELLDTWLDGNALLREVLGPAVPDGPGEILPRLWDPATDRSYRAERVRLPPDGVVLLHGALLLGRGLPADLTIHLHLSENALRRQLPAAEHWALPAYARYEAERAPTRAADVVILRDHPARPAMIEP